MSEECRIDAMIVGAEKAGTTTLGSHLARHPRILSHLGSDVGVERMEFPGFVSGAYRDPEAFRRAYLEYFGRDPRPDERVIGKSVGIMHEPEAAEALHRHSPTCGVVVSLRNPVDRAYSSFWYQRYRGTEDAATFEEALERELERAERDVRAPDRAYLGKGRYVDHLERLVGLFGRERMHMVLLEDLKKDPASVVNQVFEFLDLEPRDVDEVIVKNRAKRARWPKLARAAQGEGWLRSTFRALVPRRGRRMLWGWLRRMNAIESAPPPMDPEMRERLVAYYRPYNERLGGLLGRSLEHWNR